MADTVNVRITLQDPSETDIQVRMSRIKADNLVYQLRNGDEWVSWTSSTTKYSTRGTPDGQYTTEVTMRGAEIVGVSITEFKKDEVSSF